MLINDMLIDFQYCILCTSEKALREFLRESVDFKESPEQSVSTM